MVDQKGHAEIFLRKIQFDPSDPHVDHWVRLLVGHVTLLIHVALLWGQVEIQ